MSDDYKAIQSETAVLATLLQDPSLFITIAPRLRSEFFSNPGHMEIFQAMHESAESAPLGSEPFDALTIATTARKMGYGDHKNTPTGETVTQYVHTLYGESVVGDIGFHIEEIAEASTRRLVTKHASALLEAVGDPTSPVRETVLPMVEGIEDAVADVLSDDGSIKQFGEVIAEFTDRIQNPQHIERIPTGFEELDDRFLSGGLESSRVITVGARPGVGKTAFALSLARQAAFREKKHVLFASFEMPPEQLMRRIIAAEANVTLSALNNPNYLNSQQKHETLSAIARATGRIQRMTNFDIDDENFDPEKGGLYFWDRVETTVREFLLKAREMHKRGQLDLIILDYLQLLRLGERSESRQLEVSSIIRAVKTQSLAMQIPVVVLSQLNREVAGRADKRPNLSDLRESGAIEQDSDIVILLWRDDEDDLDNERLNVAVEKNRDGPMGQMQLDSQLAFGRFAPVVVESSGW